MVCSYNKKYNSRADDTTLPQKNWFSNQMDQENYNLNTNLNQDGLSFKKMKDCILELLKEANSKHEFGNLDDAIKILQNAEKKVEDLSKTHPKTKKTKINSTLGYTLDIVFLYKYGNILYDIEEYQGSLDKYKEIDKIQIRPDVQKAQGDCFRNLCKYEEAHKKYQEALQLYKTNDCSLEDEAALYNSIGLLYVAQGDNENALKEFEKATNDISLNPLYYCNKGSILYCIAGQEERARNCFTKAVKFYEEGRIEGLTTQNIYYISEVLKPLINLEHDFQKEPEAIKDLKKTMNNWMLLQEKKNSSIQAELKDAKRRIEKIESDIESIYREVFINKEEFEKFALQSIKIHNMFNEDLRVLQIDMNGVIKQLVYINDTLVRNNSFDEEQIREKFESLRQKHGENVYTYATVFYRALSDSLLAYRLISTGLIKGESKNPNIRGVLGSMFSCFGIKSRIFKFLGFADVSQSISIAIGILNIVNCFFEKISEAKLARVSKNVVDNMTNSLLDKDIDLVLAKSAIDIAIAKKEAIEKGETHYPTGKLKNLIQWLKKKSEKLATMITEVNSVPETVASKMALKDVTLYITYSFVKSNSKHMNGNESVELLSKDIMELLISADNQLFATLYKNTSSVSTDEDTVS
ncbi:uncharacterized protein LOC100198971 isoform X2 [Hydra vulgaris]|uniref:uncharacterized protein LOC100198971 isoform X2 n=1 Tax=Hydra vulgaris TaxID=6087 RepID=UPI001F5F5CFA|nr:uncharacterized protein LOC100198971 isoform X2 [Hydra vulgaris]XP_047144865.1 uncharacterized protein LOC100198971 isoform X2 [Hydra vulgaris]